MNRYEAYRDSGIDWIGEIPEHWEVSKFKYLFNFGMGETILKKDLNGDGIPVLSATAEYTVLGYYKNPGLILNIGDLVIPARGNSIGHVKIVKEKSVSTQTTIYGKKKTLVDTIFTQFFCIGYKDQLFQFDQTAIPQITVNQVQNNPILIPPLEEQNRIARYLNKKTTLIDSLVEKLQKKIELLGEQRAARINQAVTRGLDPDVEMKDSGVEWAGEIPKHWEVKRLGYLGSFSNGVSKGAEFFESGHPFITYSDVYKNETLPAPSGVFLSTEKDWETYSVRYGDIFFTRTSETIDDIGISSVCMETIEKCCFSGFLVRFRPSSLKLQVKYSRHYFRSTIPLIHYTKEMNLVTRSSLSQRLLKTTPVFIPPLEEQNRIARYLDKKTKQADSLVEKLSRKIELLKEYRQALISSCVTGKVQVTEDMI